MNETERLAKIAELLPGPCPEPGIADGMDMCICRSGEVFPCSTTQATWLARGLDPAEENRKALSKAKAQMAAEQLEYEAILGEEGEEAARQYAMRKLGW